MPLRSDDHVYKLAIVGGGPAAMGVRHFLLVPQQVMSLP